ncbi:MAG: hypothetical protein PHW02_02845 [bacterium]|nr:hypothetical protein [bacterium]
MKKMVFLILSLCLFAAIAANEIFIQEGGRFYKVELSDNGDTLSKVEIQIVPADTALDEYPLHEIKNDVETKSEIQDEEKGFNQPVTSPEMKVLYNPQLLRIVPFKWQAGWYGAWQGFSYGMMITQGLGISEKRYAPLVYLSTPTLMFFLPPILIKDDVPDYALAFTDWGYRLGPIDYLALRTSISPDGLMEEDSFGIGGTYHKYNADALAATVMGYAETWGGYTLARKLGPFRRAASDIYAAGSYMGYIWGGLTGLYLAEKIVTEEYPVYDTLWYMDPTKWTEDSIAEAAYLDEIEALDKKRFRYTASTAFLASVGLRAAGFYFGNQEKYNLKSFDGYFYTFNSIPGFLLAFEIENFTDLEEENLLVYTGLSILTTGATAYLMRDIHLDDGNAILMMIGGIVGGALGQGVERVIAGPTSEKLHSSVGALCMVAGELGVYYLRKDAIESGSDFGTNIGFNVYPTVNNGLGANLSYRF